MRGYSDSIPPHGPLAGIKFQHGIKVLIVDIAILSLPPQVLTLCRVIYHKFQPLQSYTVSLASFTNLSSLFYFFEEYTERKIKVQLQLLDEPDQSRKQSRGLLHVSTYHIK